jgi:hypothetical protein
MTAPRRAVQPTRRDLKQTAQRAVGSHDPYSKTRSDSESAASKAFTNDVMSKSALTRRALVASTAAIPAAAVLPIAVQAAASSADDQLTALASEVFRLWNDHYGTAMISKRRSIP